MSDIAMPANSTLLEHASAMLRSMTTRRGGSVRFPTTALYPPHLDPDGWGIRSRSMARGSGRDQCARRLRARKLAIKGARP